MPGAELVLHVHDIAPSPETLIVVNCAGRTRSIIGAQSLINAGVPNKVVALRNGTMGWHLAGLTCDKGKTARFPAVTPDGLAWAKPAAGAVARKFDVPCTSMPETLERWRADETRTTYVFDVREPAEYERRPLSWRDLRAGRPTSAGDRPICRRARRAHRAVRRQRGARGDDSVMAQADGLEGGRGAAGGRR